MQQIREVPQETPAKEAPQLFAICNDDRLMPCVFVRWQEGAEVVRPVNSQREYSFSPDRIISASEGEAELLRRKVRGVRANYSFVELSPEPARAVLCSHPTDKKRAYILSLGAGGWLCTCHAFNNSLHTNCKHTQAMYERDEQPAPVQPVAAEDW